MITCYNSYQTYIEVFLEKKEKEKEILNTSLNHRNNYNKLASFLFLRIKLSFKEKVNHDWLKKPAWKCGGTSFIHTDNLLTHLAYLAGL